MRCATGASCTQSGNPPLRTSPWHHGPMRSTTSNPSRSQSATNAAHVEPVAEVAMPALGFVVVPEHVGGHHGDAARAHEAQALLPLVARHPAVVHLARDRDRRAAVDLHVPVREGDAVVPVDRVAHRRSRQRAVVRSVRHAERDGRRGGCHGVRLLRLCALPVLSRARPRSRTGAIAAAARDRLGRMTQPLLDRAPRPYDADAMYDAFVEWADERGFALYPAQDEAIIEIVSGANVILSTPTGTGKSLVAVAAHAASVARGGRSYYTAPIKALVSEKFFQLVEIFGAANVGMVTGDSSVNPDAPIICCTAEILANLALRQGPDAAVDQVVMDEFHYYGDPDRGWAWQVPLITLHARAVHPHVGDARRRHRDRRRPHPPHRPRDRASHRRRPPGAAALLLREDAGAGDRRGAPRDPPGARLHRALLAGRRDGAGAGPVVDPGGHARAARRDRRRDRRVPLHHGLRQDALAARARGHRRAPRGHAAALPPPRRDARAARAAPGHLRHRHAGRRHQRADPHGAHHRASRSSTGSGCASSAPASSTRSPGGPVAPATTRRAPSSCSRPSTRSRTRPPSARRATTRRSSRRSCARRRPAGQITWGEGSFERLVAAEPEPLAPQLKLTAAMLINVIARGDDVAGDIRSLVLRQPRAACPHVRARAPRARHPPHAARRRRRRDRCGRRRPAASPTCASRSTCSRTSRSTSRSRRSRSPRSSCSTPTRRRGRGSAPATTPSTW